MANNDDKTEEESIEGLELDTHDDESSDDNEASLENDSESEHSAEENDIVDDGSINVQKKQKNIKKILIIASAALFSIILLIIILYFVGIFDNEPVKPEPLKVLTTEVKKDEIPLVPEIAKYKFKIKDIDKKRLNRKLSLLTKHELIEEVVPKPKKPIVENHEIDKKMQESKIKSEVITDTQNTKETVKDKSIEKLAVDNLIKQEEIIPSINTTENILPKEAEKNISETMEIKTKEPVNKIEKEEKIISKVVKEKEVIKEENLPEKMLSQSDLPKDIEDTTIKIEEKEDEKIIEEDKDKKENNILQEKKTEEKPFLKFAQIATIKKNLYLSFLHQLKDIDSRISVCRNDINYIQIFVGPFPNDKERKEALIKINKSIVKDAFAIDFTQEEFNKRCNY